MTRNVASFEPGTKFKASWLDSNGKPSSDLMEGLVLEIVDAKDGKYALVDLNGSPDYAKVEVWTRDKFEASFGEIDPAVEGPFMLINPVSPADYAAGLFPKYSTPVELKGEWEGALILVL